MLESDSVSGEADATSGFFNARPRYFVVRSIILHPVLSLKCSLRARVPRQQWPEFFVRALLRDSDRHATGGLHLPAPSEAGRAPLRGCCGRAWCSELPGRYIV